jgi:uncharacterized damage-inducible protein DinB
MNDELKLMYGWVHRTREVLFSFTDSLPSEIYTLERPDFAYGSIRNIHAHVADCYLYWVGSLGLKYNEAKLLIPKEQITDSKTMRERFAFVDSIVTQALETFDNLDAKLEHQQQHGVEILSQRWLIVHPITHEFHHKGQLLALARVLEHPLPAGKFMDLVMPFE